MADAKGSQNKSGWMVMEKTWEEVQKKVLLKYKDQLFEEKNFSEIDTSIACRHSPSGATLTSLSLLDRRPLFKILPKTSKRK